jgi:hypothetical protein
VLARADVQSDRGLHRALAVCAVLGALSVLVAAPLGFDPWAWMVWGRELVHLDLHTTGGPSWKPLPVLLVAPLTPFGNLAPDAWLALVRAAALVALVLAFRIAARVGGGPLGGAVAVAGLAVSTDFFVTALRGSSEPLLLALVLAAIDQHLRARPRVALGLGALAGLLRPEIWLFTALYGAYLLARDGRAAATLARMAQIGTLVAVAPAVWLGLDWLGSGDALEASNIARTAPPGSASKTASPTLTVIERAGDAVILPILVLALVAVVLAVRRRDRALLWLCGLAAGWIAVVALLAEQGFAGRRRYVIVAAAIMCVVAGAGFGAVLQHVGARARRALLAGAAVALALFAFVPARADWRLLGLGRKQEAQLSELRAAVQRAGGAQRIRARGTAVVNPFAQTALAWELHARLADVHGPTVSTRARPRWTPPATIFRAPARLAGTRPALPARARARLVARAGRWRVYAAGK